MLVAMSWIGWALLSAVFAAATALLAKVGVEHVDSNLATALRTTVVMIWTAGRFSSSRFQVSRQAFPGFATFAHCSLGQLPALRRSISFRFRW